MGPAAFLPPVIAAVAAVAAVPAAAPSVSLARAFAVLDSFCTSWEAGLATRLAKTALRLALQSQLEGEGTHW